MSKSNDKGLDLVSISIKPATKFLIIVKDPSTTSGERSFTVMGNNHIEAASAAVRMLFTNAEELYAKRVAGSFKCDGKFHAHTRDTDKPQGHPFVVRVAEEEPPPLKTRR